jgi:hypothetical protein
MNKQLNELNENTNKQMNEWNEEDYPGYERGNQ